MNKQARKQNLLPGGVPKYVRCYDNNGKTLDRYTVVFTGNYKKQDHEFYYLGMSANPFQGIGQHGETQFQPCDRPTYSHLGKKIKFEDLPTDCKKAVLRDYLEIWQIN